MEDIVAMAVGCAEQSRDEQQRKINFCNCLLDQFKEMKGEELYPHLSEVTFNKKTQVTQIVLNF